MTAPAALIAQQDFPALHDLIKRRPSKNGYALYYHIRPISAIRNYRKTGHFLTLLFVVFLQICVIMTSDKTTI